MQESKHVFSQSFSNSHLADVLSRRLLFVSGKGGVGKTAVSRAIARVLPGRVLWCCFEDPTRKPAEKVTVSDRLSELNCEAGAAFEEYIEMKLGLGPVTRIFLQNKVIRYLAQAAPGIHELVLLGKIWHERLKFDHVVCDMPSTGYGLAMFQSTENFAALFHGGPVHRDADAMAQTFGNPLETGHLIVALAEEMPLIESLELAEALKQRFPANSPAFIANRMWGANVDPTLLKNPEETLIKAPLAQSINDFLNRRIQLEQKNLDIWRQKRIEFSTLALVPPGRTESDIVQALCKQIGKSDEN